MNSSKQNYFLKLYRKQNSVKACSMPPFRDPYININRPHTNRSTQFYIIEILRVTWSHRKKKAAIEVKYKEPSLDFGLKMRAPTVTRKKRWNKEEPLHPLGMVNLSAVVSKIIKNSYLQKHYIIYQSLNRNNKYILRL